MTDQAISNLLSQLNAVSSRLEVVEKQLATGTGSSTASSSSSSSSSNSGGDSPSVQNYENLMHHITNYINLSKQIGASDVVEQATLVEKAILAQRDMLRVAACSKKPTPDVVGKLCQPTSDLMQKITAIRDSNRSSKHFNHLSTVSEGIPALGWVLVSPLPAPHVGDMRGGSEFYSNRILKDFKGKEQVHVDWVAAFNTFLKDLQAYVKQYHTTGLEWNPRGGDALSASSNVSTSSSSSSSTPPPPGPPPPPVFTESNTSSSGGKQQAVDTSKLFSELSKGTEITKGLKKVTADQKTKNWTDKSSVVPATATTAKTSTSSGKKEVTTKPPKFALEGSKWAVENQVGNREIVISETEAKQTCYIFKCSQSTVHISGKINAIFIDSCNKTAVVFDSVVSSVDIVNCNSVELQVTGKVPSINVDKTSGCQLYLGKESLATEIYTSKSSETNVLIPGKEENDDLVEIAIPEQYRTIVKDGKLITECSSHV